MNAKEEQEIFEYCKIYHDVPIEDLENVVKLAYEIRGILWAKGATWNKLNEFSNLIGNIRISKLKSLETGKKVGFDTIPPISIEEFLKRLEEK